jgi:hypothetical protein
MLILLTISLYAADSIKDVLKKREKLEYEQSKGLLGMTSFIPEYITIHRFSTKYQIKSCLLMNKSR